MYLYIDIGDTMLTYSEIQTYVDNGDTNQEIADALNAITRHRKDIYATKEDSDPNNPDLLFLLQARFDVLQIGYSAGWEGDLIDAVQALGNPTLENGMKKLLTNLQITGRKVATHSDTTGLTGYLVEVIADIVGDLVVLKGTFTKEKVLADVLALTGGRIYQNITAEDIQAVKDLKSKNDALQIIIDKANNAIEAAQEEYRNAESTASSIIAAGEDVFNE